MFRTQLAADRNFGMSRDQIVASCARAAVLQLVLLVVVPHRFFLAEHLQPAREKNGRFQQQQQQHVTTVSTGKTRTHGQLSTGSMNSMFGTVTDGDRENDGVCELEINCRLVDGNTTQPIRLPFRGPRGPRGQQGQKGDRGEVGKPGAHGPPGYPAPVVQGVAFFVGLKENLGPIANHADVVFDGIVTNIGGAYDADTGRFNAPLNGTYQFNIVVAAQGRQRAAVMVLKNGSQVVTVWAESIPYWSTSCNVIILSLVKDDQVWLVLLNKASFLHGYMYTTFSGFLLF